MPTVRCNRCSKEFYAKPHWLDKGHGKYCSQKCCIENQKTGKLFSCFMCKKKAYRSRGQQKKSRSGRYFCSKSCQTTWRNTIVYVGKNHSNWKHGTTAYRNIMKRAKIAPICARCNNDDVRILTAHHKDRNRQNNDVSNLVWLCHNCHFLVHRYKSEAGDFVVPVA